MHFQTSHPKSTLKGIIKGEAIRFIRTNTSVTKYNHILTQLITHLQYRGYPKKFIFSALRNISYTNREKYLSSSRKQQTSNTKPLLTIPRLIIQYSPHYSSIHTCINFYWHIISQDPKLSCIFSDKPQICFKKNLSISNHLVRVHLSENELPPFTSLSPLHMKAVQRSKVLSHCNLKVCSTCNHILQLPSILSLYISKTFSINQTINCQDKNVIYALQCTICSKLYVGRTNPSQTLKEKHLSHICSSLNKKTQLWPLYSHFTRHKTTFCNGHTLIPLQKCRPRFLRMLEKVWIYKLDTISPKGLNNTLP